MYDFHDHQAGLVSPVAPSQRAGHCPNLACTILPLVIYFLLTFNTCTSCRQGHISFPLEKSSLTSYVVTGAFKRATVNICSVDGCVIESISECQEPSCIACLKEQQRSLFDFLWTLAFLVECI